VPRKSDGPAATRRDNSAAVGFLREIATSHVGNTIRSPVCTDIGRFLIYSEAAMNSKRAASRDSWGRSAIPIWRQREIEIFDLRRRTYIGLILALAFSVTRKW
jgi:hypothetical protein